MIQFQSPYLTVFQSALYQTTSTVIHIPDLTLVVDPNWLPDEIREIRACAMKAGNAKPLYLLFTHSDYDHILGWGAFPEAKVIASQAFVQNPEKQELIEQILKWDDDYYVARDYPIRYPEVDIEVTHEGQILEIGNTRLTFYLAPGHNPDGIFTLVEMGGETANVAPAVWLAGDYLCDVEFPYIYHSVQAYEETLAKTDLILEKHDIRLLVPGHGLITENVAEMIKRKEEALDYIRQLRSCVVINQPFDEGKLWERYRFRRSMQKFHDENIELMKKENGGE